MSKEFPSLDIQEVHFNREDDPHGWIQWKGTEVCLDLHCTCGELTHFDGGFMYHIKCPFCGQVYEANGHIQLIPLDFEPSNCKAAFK